MTQYTQTLLNEVYGVEREKLVVVYNGLKDEAIKLSEEERLEKRFALGFRETDKIILFVGRLDRIKGVQYLIEAFRRVIRKNPNSRLVIVGDGDYDKYLKQCAGIWSYVVFTGKVEKEVLYTFIR
ncbi:glycosyltransferase [Bacteroides fragilis]|nr:glycosyltransferase [Bacteroides fragilis]